MLLNKLKTLLSDENNSPQTQLLCLGALMN